MRQRRCFGLARRIAGGPAAAAVPPVSRLDTTAPFRRAAPMTTPTAIVRVVGSNARRIVADVSENGPPDQPWYADGLAFECTGCGGCCTGHGFVWVDDEELADLARLQRRDVGELRLLDTKVRNGRRTLREHGNGDCIYLDGRTRRCTVYAARPRQCRTWPFWRQNLESPAAWDRESANCPGMNRGDVVPLAEVEAAAARSGL